MGAFNGYVVVDSIDNNLQIDFFDTLGNKYPKLHKEGLGLAIDPISELIAKELFEQTAQATGSRTKIKSELPHLLKLAKIQDTTSSEFFVKVELTDRSKSRVKIKMRSINAAADRHSRYNTKDFDLVESVVKRSKILNTDLAIVIKNSVTSKYFIDKFKSTYNNIYLSKDEFVDIVELFISNEDVINGGNFAHKITEPIVVKPISTLESKPSVSSPAPAPQPTLSPSVRPISKPQIKSGSVKKSPPPPPPLSKPPMVSKAIAIKTKVKTPPPARTPIPSKSVSKKSKLVAPLPPPPPPRPPMPSKSVSKKSKPGAPLPPPPPSRPPMPSKSVSKKSKPGAPPPPPPPPRPPMPSKSVSKKSKPGAPPPPKP